MAAADLRNPKNWKQKNQKQKKNNIESIGIGHTNCKDFSFLLSTTRSIAMIFCERSQHNVVCLSVDLGCLKFRQSTRPPPSTPDRAYRATKIFGEQNFWILGALEFSIFLFVHFNTKTHINCNVFSVKLRFHLFFAFCCECSCGGNWRTTILCKKSKNNQTKKTKNWLWGISLRKRHTKGCARSSTNHSL